MEMAKMEKRSEDVRRRRWKFIGHIMTKGYDNGWRTAMTWTPEGHRRRAGGRTRTTWRTTAEKERK